LPYTMIGGVSGATAQSRLPCRNGMSSNRMRRLHGKAGYRLQPVPPGIVPSALTGCGNGELAGQSGPAPAL
jgi:hypothetical protein